MDLRNFGGRDVDIDLERGMNEAIYEEHSEGRRAEGEEKMGLLDNKSSRRGRKKGSRKPPKPPRPPCAPLLDAADRNLVRELSELATLKRARVERMKALKNKKNTEGASSGSNLCALVVTILFCFIIIWQAEHKNLESLWRKKYKRREEKHSHKHKDIHDSPQYGLCQ